MTLPEKNDQYMDIDKIYLGDCIELMKEIPDRSIDCIICDLPYGTTACAWDNVIPFDKLWEQYKRIAKPNAPIVLFGNEPFSTFLRISNIKNWKYDWIWDKKMKGGFLNAKKRPLKQYEIISVFSYGNCVYNPQMTKGLFRNKSSYNKRDGNGDGVYGKFRNIETENDIYYPSNILEYSNAAQKGKMHPTQKPVELIRYLIRTYTNEGDLILDNCIGSGTTAVAAIKEKRHFIGMELNKEYYDIACKRVKDELSNPALF